jgi:hypothetical protein
VNTHPVRNTSNATRYIDLVGINAFDLSDAENDVTNARVTNRKLKRLTPPSGNNSRADASSDMVPSAHHSNPMAGDRKFVELERH